MTSRPVYTSTAEGFRDAKEIAGLRPIAEPKPRAPRKAANPVLRQVTNGIVCFCGERFGESQSLEFMLHLRAEVGEVLEWRERKREISREASARYYRRVKDGNPEQAARRRELNRQHQAELRADPEYHEKVRMRQQEWYRKRRADPEYREKMNARARELRKPKTAEQREREAARKREERARKRAEGAAASTPLVAKRTSPRLSWPCYGQDQVVRSTSRTWLHSSP